MTTYFLNPILLIYGLEGIRLIIGEIDKVFEIKPDPKVLDKWLPYLWSRDEMQADSLDRARNFLPSAFSQLRVPPPTFLPYYTDATLKKKSLLLEKFHDTTHLFVELSNKCSRASLCQILF